MNLIMYVYLFCCFFCSKLKYKRVYCTYRSSKKMFSIGCKSIDKQLKSLRFKASSYVYIRGKNPGNTCVCKCLYARFLINVYKRFSFSTIVPTRPAKQTVLLRECEKSSPTGIRYLFHNVRLCFR